MEGEKLGRQVGTLAPRVEQQKMEQNSSLLRLEQLEQLEQNSFLRSRLELQLLVFWLGS